MKRLLRSLLVSALLVPSLAACGGTASVPATLPPATATSSSSSIAPASTAPKSTVASQSTVTPARAKATSGASSSGDSAGTGNASIINVTVKGGPNAGTYERRAAQTTCSYGLAGEGSWGNQYSDSDITNGLSSLQLIVPSTKEAANGTSSFLVTFTFGKMLDPNSTNYTVDGRQSSNPQGKGSVTVQDNGSSGKVTIHAEPEATVSVDATIQCNDVLRAPGGSNSSGKSGGQPQGPTATIKVTLDGGASPGTYEATPSDEICGYGQNGVSSALAANLDKTDDAFTVDYTNNDSNSKFSSLQLIVPSTTAAAQGTNVFYLSINDQQYYLDNLNGSNKDGSGRVKVQRNGDSATVTITVQTKDGSKVNATIECHKVSQ